MTHVLVTITKKQNHIWAGQGRLISVDINRGIAIVLMRTGRNKGEMGGFDMTGLRFKTIQVPGEVVPIR